MKAFKQISYAKHLVLVTGFLLVVCILGIAKIAVAQEPAPPIQRYWYDGIVVTVSEVFNSKAMDVIGWTAALVFGGLAAYFKGQTKKLMDKLQSIFAPVSQIDRSKSFNSVIVAGLSGSGKTTLIHSLTGDPDANPRIETPDYRIFSYEHVFPAGAVAAQSCKIFLSDYPGTNPGALLSGFIEQQKLSFSPMRFRHVQSVIFVLDLFPPPSSPGAAQRSKDDIDQNRVDENNVEWNYQALSMLMGLVPQAKFLCLFINKADMLNGSSNEVERISKAAYKDVYDNLASLGRGAEVKRICGSTKTGDGVDQLRTLLIGHSKVYGT